MLVIRDLNVYYGKAHALKDVSLHVQQDEIVALIGNNGAGKSTLLKAISGLHRPNSGQIFWDNVDITNISSDQIVKKGIIQVPEGRRVFPHLSVKDNLLLGGYTCSLHQRNDGFERVFTLFPRLKERSGQPAGTLSGGEQQMLAVGRALMARPKLLLLDEPSLGLAPIVVESIYETIKEIHRQGIPVLLVEQNAFLALMTAKRAYVIDTGRVVISGDAKDLLEDEQVRRAYLGG